MISSMPVPGKRTIKIGNCPNMAGRFGYALSGRGAKGRFFPFIALALALTCVPVRPSGPVEPNLSSPERAVLDEYRLFCQPGRYFDEVRTNLETMQGRHPKSAFLQDSVFLAEVHYMDNRYLRDGNGKQLGEWGPYIDGAVFAKYPPSREAWRQYRINEQRAFIYGGLGVLLLAGNGFFALYGLFNAPPRGGGELKAYRFAQLALPTGWIGSFIYGGICAGKKDRALDDAFFESNGRAIAERLATDP